MKAMQEFLSQIGRAVNLLCFGGSLKKDEETGPPLLKYRKMNCHYTAHSDDSSTTPAMSNISALCSSLSSLHPIPNVDEVKTRLSRIDGRRRGIRRREEGGARHADLFLKTHHLPSGPHWTEKPEYHPSYVTKLNLSLDLLCRRITRTIFIRGDH